MNEQELGGGFGFEDSDYLDSLQEQVAEKKNLESEKEPELTNADLDSLQEQDIQRQIREAEEENKYAQYLESLPKEERERLEQESLEIAITEEESKKQGKELNANANTKEQEKTQEEIDLEYSLAKMKQDLEQDTRVEFEAINLTYPEQKRDFLSETLEIVDKGITPSIQESLEILEKIDEVESQIANKEKEQLNAKEQDKDSTKTILDSEIDEAFAKEQQEQQEKHQKELEALQKEKESLKRNFEASIENLIKQGDVKDLLKNLQTLDEAFAKFLKKTKKECDLLAKQRIEKLKLAMQSENVKEAVSGFVKELHTNRKEVIEQSKELDMQKEWYEGLKKQQEKCFKGDEKSKENARFELQQNLNALEEKHPTFKENYSKFYKELEKTTKEPQKQQEKTQERQRSA